MCNQVYIIQKSKNVFYVTFIANLRVTQLAHQGAHVTTCRGPGPNFWRVLRPVHGPVYMCVKSLSTWHQRERVRVCVKSKRVSLTGFPPGRIPSKQEFLKAKQRTYI